ncbi:MAG: elongation factor EF-2 [Promethearchaeota archaeon]|nr:MAG: elongation factor EF-2 [Candidatus Lokiarchaeota archaeon]
MARVKNWELMLELMKRIEKIRNVGIIAHIDHGKTTLSDILLAKSGLISKSIAGEARALDYLEEEQKRGITIKAANISLLFEKNSGEQENSYIINLIDTPGHVDFSGRVTRALRVIDGCIVVVDAVEGCMVQTEILTRQALSESVKPILFINKIDRLIKELKLTEEKVQARLDYIIQTYNKILKNVLPRDLYEDWEIKPQKNNVIFGSAIHHWGFTFNQMVNSGKKFGSIIEIYDKFEKVNEIRRVGYELFPLDIAILSTIVDCIPDPKQAQKYRIGSIWKGNIDSEAGKDLLNCNKKGMTIIGINKIMKDPHAGFIAIGRIFSGIIKTGDKLFLMNKKSEFRPLNLYIYMGASKYPIKQLEAGNIIGISGSSDITIGETLIEAKSKEKGTPFEKIIYSQDPVVTVSIEPYHPREIKEMVEILEELDQEDPNLEINVNKETGEYLISGIGELHLELVEKDIEKKGIKVITTEPMVIHVESIEEKSAILEFMAEDNSLFIKYQIEPLDSDTLQLFQKGIIDYDQKKEENSRILLERASDYWTEKDTQSIITTIEKSNMIIDRSNKNSGAAVKKFTKENEFFTELFRATLKKGPLIDSKIFGLKITILDYQIQENLLNLGPIMILEQFKLYFYSIYKDCQPIILEPIYKIQINTLVDYIGKSTNLIEKNRGSIENIDSDSVYANITGYIPVSETFNLADEMRSKTSGWALWQTILSHWSKVPRNIHENLVN